LKYLFVSKYFEIVCLLSKLSAYYLLPIFFCIDAQQLFFIGTQQPYIGE